MAAKYVLGCQTLQLNHDVSINGDQTDSTVNQLEYFKRLNLFADPKKVSSDTLPSLANYHDEAAPLNDRARAYLHANCSHCHRNGGGGNADFFALASMELDQLHILDAKANHGQFQIQQPAIIKQGNPLKSLLYYRMSSLGGGRMPRLGSTVIDERGLDLIHDWIASLTPGQPSETASSNVPASSNAPASSNDSLHEQIQTIIDRESVAVERQASIDQLLSTTPGALLLARATQNDKLSYEVRDTVVRAAVQGDPHIRNLFERFLPEQQRTKRLGRSVDPSAILALNGNAEQGRALFHHESGVQCRDCHRIKNQGKAVGPDLDQIGKKYDRRQTLTSILEPSRNVDAKYMQYQCLTNDGQVHTGIIVEKTARHVTLRDAKSDLHKIASEEIDELSPLTTSMMPELLVQDLTAQQLADLVAFLDSLE